MYEPADYVSRFVTENRGPDSWLQTLAPDQRAALLRNAAECLPGETVEAPAPDDTGERMRLRSACIAYGRARRFPVTDALFAMWTDDSPLETVGELETLFRTLCYDDSLATSVFFAIRAPERYR